MLPEPAPPAWPPEEFRKRKGPYAAFAKKEDIHHEEIVASYVPQSDIHPLVLPRDGEFVVPWDGATLRRFLAERKILHLIYVGFATNWCIQFKEYGMRDQARQGYNCILLRDCTNATESADTLDGELLLRAAIREIESAVGWTAAGKDFIEACRNVSVLK
jgi:nicotinamidase-related amidase